MADLRTGCWAWVDCLVHRFPAVYELPTFCWPTTFWGAQRCVPPAPHLFTFAEGKDTEGRTSRALGPFPRLLLWTCISLVFRGVAFVPCAPSNNHAGFTRRRCS